MPFYHRRSTALRNLPMTQTELIGKARTIGLSGPVLHLPKKELIREIQKFQGQKSCFLSDNRYECVTACEWSRQCKKLTSEWRRQGCSKFNSKFNEEERISDPATGQANLSKTFSTSVNGVITQQHRFTAVPNDLQTRSAFPKTFERGYEPNITCPHSMADNL